MDLKNIFNIIKRFLKHTAGLGCTVAAVLLAMWFIQYKFVQPATAKSEKSYINDIYDRPIVQLQHEETFEQPFEAHGDIYGMQIRWHNLAQVQNGTALIELTDADTGDVLASTVYDLRLIVNDVYNEIPFDEPYLNSEEGYQPYILRITPTFDNPQESYLKIWGDYSTNTIAFGILKYIVNSSSLFGWFGLLRKAALAAAVILYAVCFIFKLKKEAVFAVALVAVSCLFTLVLPPYSSPDEEGHFNTAYRLANKFDGYTDEDFGYMRFYKRSCDQNEIFEDKYTTVFNYEYIYENLDSRDDGSDMLTVEDAWLVTDFEGVYFMGALGIKLAHMLNLGYVPLMYLGRMMNLLFYALCLYFAIKITPVGKEVFMALGLLPISLHLANSFSRDVFVIALGFLFTAYLLYLLKQEETYKWWQLLLLAVMCALIAPSKFIYATLCIGVFLLDMNKIPLLNRIKWKIHPLVLVGIPAVAVVAVMTKYLLDTNPMFRWKIFAIAPMGILLDPELSIDHGYSLQLALDNPVYTLKMLVNTVFANGAYYIKSFAGGVLSYNSINISDAFIFIILIMVVIAAFASANDSYTLKKRERIAFGGIFFILLSIVLFMCLTWTFVRMETLYGLQGKYLLPVMPMLLIALRGKSITINRDLFRHICFVIAFTDIFVALNAFVVILQR